MPACEESLMRSSCKAAGETHVRCRSLGSVIPPVAVCIPGLHPTTTTSRCDMRVHVRKYRWEHFSSLSQKLKALELFHWSAAERPAPKQDVVFVVVLHVFSALSQGIQIQLLLSVMYPLVNAAFGHLYPASLFHWCEVKKHIMTWQDVTRSKYAFTGSLRIIGEEHGLETLSVSDLFASFSTFDCRHFSELFFFLPSKKQLKYLNL